MFFKIVGMISVFTIVVSSVSIAISGVLGIVLVRKKRLVMPKLLLFLVDNFYFPLKWFANVFGANEKIVDRLGVETRNFIQYNRFSRVNRGERVLLLPHCLRHPKCSARLDPRGGVACKGCGLCVIKDLKAQADTLGYTVIVAPGSGFVRRKIRDIKPGAALCVACYKDLNHVMQSISRSKIPVQGVPLIKDGCVETAVDMAQLSEAINLHA